MIFPQHTEQRERPNDGVQLEEWELIFEEDDRRAVDALAPEVKQSVLKACADIGLSQQWTFEVLLTTSSLINFESNERKKVLTPAEHYAALKRVQDAAQSLREALSGLSVFDVLDLGLAANDLHLDLRDTGLKPHDVLLVATADSPLAMLVMASERLLNERLRDAGKGGRRPLLSKYGYFVQCLAEAFTQEGFRVGRGGAFERFCKVVFEAAGVRATPEGAIRYYLAKRKKLAQKELENSGEEAAK